nr:glycosyltransferase family 2 protein [uncultured Rhodopila sp.]
MQAFLRTYSDTSLQSPMDAAVVIPTVLRPVLREALDSVFAQRFHGRIHVLIGIDNIAGDLAMLDAACAARPSHIAVQAYWPGYSTSARHGGLTPPGDGGALRCVLTHLANSPFVAYLDDDNWWGPDHLFQMRQAIDLAEWSFALRWFVHPVRRRPVCVDVWESVGPGQGMFQANFGGFVDPSCLMLNKVACPTAALRWNFPLRNDPMSADRSVFDLLSRHHRVRGTGQASVYYTLNPRDGLHPLRLQRMGAAYDQVERFE